DTFLYTKLALERAKPASLLDVRFSSTDSTTNVQRSVAQEGHTILSEPRQLSEDHWQLLIKRRTAPGSAS
ncbi:MAG: sulfurtransferase TusA family protein, partial [Bdellovibrionales bacterium]|nr:sulfurtransferase TusA family protein [Bdellovibrionales bacterium]